MFQSKKVTEGAKMLAIFFAVLMISIFVPFAFIFCLVILPVPFVVYTYRQGYQAGLLLLAVAILFSLIIIPLLSLPLTILAGLGGWMIGFGLHKRISPYETWARGTIGFIIGLLFIFLFTQFVLNVNWVEEIEIIIDESINVSSQLIEQIGMEEPIDEQMEMIEEQLSMIIHLIPAVFAIVSIVLAFISQWISYRVIKRFDQVELKFPPFQSLKLPVPLIWLYVASLVVMLFHTDINSTLYIAAYNTSLLVGFLIILQGFSFIFFYANHKWQSRVLPITSIILTVIFPFIFIMLVRLIGVIDLVFDLKERISTSKGN